MKDDNIRYAFMYRRISSHNQIGNNSLSAQEDAIRQYAKAHNIKIIGSYEDVAKSGTTMKNRPGFLKMLSDIENNSKATIILIHHFDCSNRNARDQLNVIYKLALKGISFISTDGLDSMSPDDMAEILEEAVAAQKYSIRLSRETLKGLKVNAEKMLHNGGPPPYGYTVGPDKRLHIDMAKEPAVKRIFEMYAAGMSYDKIIEWLDSNGYKTAKVELKIQRLLSEMPVPDFIWEEFYIDQRINDRGILVDTQFAEKAVELDNNVKAELFPKLKELTGLDNPNSPSQMKDWLMRKGIEAESLDKKAMPKILETAPDDVKEVLKLYQQLSKSSVSKYYTMLNASCQDGRARGMFSYYGANRTGRFAGRLIQLQNLPQNHLDDLGKIKGLIKSGDFDAVKEKYDDIPDVLSQLIRTAFITAEGKKFVVADFSAIEARVLSWLADEKWRMDAFANGEDIYCASASKMFGVPVEKNGINGHLRQKGKIAELACGYGGSIGAIKAMGGTELQLTDDELYSLVDDWRRSSPNIVKFWGDVQSVTVKVITGQNSMTFGRLKFSYEIGILFIELPSGRRLAYVRPKVEKDDNGKTIITYEGVGDNKKWVRLKTYGAKLVENITQGVARDLLLHSMATMKDMDIVGHVHDEVIVECAQDVSVEQVCHLMEQTPEWAEGLLLRADGYECEFYMKQ